MGDADERQEVVFARGVKGDVGRHQLGGKAYLRTIWYHPDYRTIRPVYNKHELNVEHVTAKRKQSKVLYEGANGHIAAAAVT